MERIQQALDLARQAREKNPQVEPAHNTDATDARRMTPPDQTASGEYRIAYSQTRVEPLSAEHLRRHRVLTGADRDDASSAYKILRTQVLQRLAARSGSTLAITSPGTGQGKTLTSINLAMSLAAKLDHTVLLVDLDLRRPSVHRYLGLTVQRGIGDYLKGEAPISDILVNPGIDRLVVLPGKDQVANSSEMLASPRMTRLLTELKSRYASRIVVFDLPPLLVGDDALTVVAQMDAVLLVLDEGRTKKTEINRSTLMLKSSHLIGTVLNRSRERVGDFY